MLAALYSVVVIALPAHAMADASMLYGDSPKTASISRSGSTALILEATDRTQIDSRILVVRANGSRVVLDLPADSVLAETFKQYALGPNGEHRFPSKRFTAVTLADDGTPFATVSAVFSGAFSGVDQGVFFWNGKWQNAYASGMPFETGNAVIAGALSVNTFVSNGNYLNYFPGPIDGQPQHYQEDQVLSTRTSQSKVLGFGDATALRGPFVVGYSPGRQTTVSADTERVVAVRWLGTQATTLGPGVARAVNSSGIVVGDDRMIRKAPGFATIWGQNGAVYRMSSLNGSIYAIENDGTMVGTLSNHAFIARWDGGRAKAQRFDDLLVDRRWNITAAFGIANSGDVLALGRLGKQLPTFLLLRPWHRESAWGAHVMRGQAARCVSAPSHRASST